MIKALMLLLALAQSLSAGVAVAALLPGVPLREWSRPAQPEVLVFIANETVPSPIDSANTTQLLNWLSEIPTTPARTAYDSINADRVLFPAVLSRDISAIREAAMSSERPLNIIIFSNQLAKTGQFLYQRAGRDRELQLGEFPRIGAWHFMTESQPLGTQAGFATALRLTSSVFPPQQHDFVLVTKSHGSTAAMMRPKVLFSTRSLSQAEFTRRVLLVRSESVVQQNSPSLGGASRIGGESYEEFLPLEPVALSKADYVGTLRSAQRQTGLVFRLAFGFACASALAQPELDALRAGGRGPLGLYYGSDGDGLNYEELRFAAVFERYQQGASLVAAMQSELDSLVPARD